MSYRSEWKKCKQHFPNVYCSIFGDLFRVVIDKNDPAAYKEINSFGNGRTRKSAWQDAVRNIDSILAYQAMKDKAISAASDRFQNVGIMAVAVPVEVEGD